MASRTSSNLPVRLISFNIRYATKEPFPGEEPWPVRCPKLCAQLNFITSGHPSAFICLQEVLYSQLADIQSRLGQSWDYVGRGRDEDPKSGEFSPIFFRSDTWTCVDHKTLWLSKTPSKPSRGWDAALNRVVTVGCFSHIETGTGVVVMSTHLDHRGEKAREESAKLLVRLACDIVQPDLPGAHTHAFLGGDFNSTPEGKAYKEITRPGTGMTDIRDLVPKEQRYGNDEITYTSFAGEEEQTRIDFLFTLTSENIKVNTFGTLSNRFDDNVFLSDHRAIVADVDIPRNAQGVS
jgi:endonuclease/exonuclease/phosphatase family metal-dependent hydrolase